MHGVHGLCDLQEMLCLSLLPEVAAVDGIKHRFVSRVLFAPKQPTSIIPSHQIFTHIIPPLANFTSI
jgi:hypothetical protein